MKKVLVLDENEDIQAILTARIARQFQAEVVVAPPRKAIRTLEEAKFALVISDVEDSQNEGFWLHRWLLDQHPRIGLILFISPDRMLRNIPQGFDSTLRGMAMKFEFNWLDQEIEKSGILGPMKIRNSLMVAPGLDGGLKC